jgi:hypothetical protein
MTSRRHEIAFFLGFVLSQAVAISIWLYVAIPARRGVWFTAICFACSLAFYQTASWLFRRYTSSLETRERYMTWLFVLTAMGTGLYLDFAGHPGTLPWTVRTFFGSLVAILSLYTLRRSPG